MGIGFDPDRASYLAAALAPARLTRVVDIGANPLSDPPYAPLLRLGLCEVWGFEPHPKAYEALTRSAGPNEHYLPHAVGSGSAGELKICKSSGWTSMLEPNITTFDALQRFHEGATVVERQPFGTRTLDSMAEIPEFDLLKIDIQGGELAVFENGRAKLAGALVVITELAGIPIYVDQPLFEDQAASLRGMGFSFHKFLSVNSFSFRGRFAERMHRRKFRSQFVDGDGVFVRGLLAFGEVETERLKHLALLADAVFDSQDLAVAVMEMLVDRDALSADAVHGYIDRLPFVSARQEA